MRLPGCTWPRYLLATAEVLLVLVGGARSSMRPCTQAAIEMRKERRSEISSSIRVMAFVQSK
eukprot:814264-Prorocentrum_minimum.AAC.3